MPATTEPTQAILSAMRDTMHSGCIVCGHGALGFGLASVVQLDGSVCARVEGMRAYEGYRGVLHGGVTSSLLDGAMTNCLFAHGIAAVTAELVVRFRHPVATDAPLSVTGKITRSIPPLYVLEAQIIQDGTVMAVAKAKFMEKKADGGEV